MGIGFLSTNANYAQELCDSSRICNFILGKKFLSRISEIDLLYNVKSWQKRTSWWRLRFTLKLSVTSQRSCFVISVLAWWLNRHNNGASRWYKLVSGRSDQNFTPLSVADDLAYYIKIRKTSRQTNTRSLL